MTTEDFLKTKPMRVIEARMGRPLEELFRELYVERGLTQAEVAAHLGIEASTVSRWMTALGIEARFPGQRPKAVA